MGAAENRKYQGVVRCNMRSRAAAQEYSPRRKPRARGGADEGIRCRKGDLLLVRR